MKTKFIILALITAMFSGCVVDYGYTTTVIYKNNSSYDIEIITEDGSHYLPKNIYIKSGETFSISGGCEGLFCGYSLFLSFASTINFPETGIYAIHKPSGRDEYHNFCSPNAYTRTEDTKRRHETFTFIFTNADYEWARDNPAKVPQAVTDLENL